MSTLVTHWLTDLDVCVVRAMSGDAANVLWDQPCWDLVVSDIELPGIDGLELARRSKARFPSRPIIMMTAHERAEYAVRALKGGADDYLHKPFERATLVDAVERQLAAANARREVILAIGAHPDDVEIGVGGLLARHRAQGDEIHILTLTGGEQGGPTGLRRVEAEQAAQTLGANLYLGDLPDTDVGEGGETIRIIQSAVDTTKPSVVYTHTINDAHQDHRATHRATVVATRQVGNVFCYQSPSTTVAFTPTCFVDITDYLHHKVAAIACYQTQVVKAPYLAADLIEATARYWGRFAKYRHVEPLEVIRETN